MKAEKMPTPIATCGFTSNRNSTHHEQIPIIVDLIRPININYDSGIY